MRELRKSLRATKSQLKANKPFKKQPFLYVKGFLNVSQTKRDIWRKGAATPTGITLAEDPGMIKGTRAKSTTSCGNAFVTNILLVRGNAVRPVAESPVVP